MSGWFDNTNITLINCDKFDDKEPWLLNDKRCSFVLVYAEWCGHCNNLKPDFIKFAEKAQFIHTYAINSEDNENLLKRINNDKKAPFKIQGYPTILIYSNGKFKEEYKGEHNWQALLHKAMKVCKENCNCSDNKKKSKSL